MKQSNEEKLEYLRGAAENNGVDFKMVFSAKEKLLESVKKNTLALI